jgi:hypothetical protein
LFATSEPIVALRPQDHHVDAPQLLAPLFGMMPAEPARFHGRVHTAPSSNVALRKYRPPHLFRHHDPDFL